MKKLLEDLRKRFPGIIGSLVLDAEGSVVEKELPSFFDFNINDFSSQVVDMYGFLKPVTQKSTLAPHRDEHDMILQFESVIIYCRLLEKGYLILIAEADANMMKLRAFSNLIVTKLSSLLKNNS
jgi:predicted regulator of Ras-like GTPase activity (Roadblock/LC7/MglB family)